ncbi:MAG: dual specificity protein phosphatase [bacterium]|nr:dual specificity protein phosphatase [bacterium]
MFDQVYDGIYVGELEAVDNQAAVRAEGITAVVRLDEHDCSSGQWNDAFALLDMPIPDGEYVDSDTIDTITDFINQQIEAGGKVLIHCHMGISRSVSMAMAYLIAYEGMSLAEAFGTVRDGREVAYPHEMLLISLIDRYELPYDTHSVHNPRFLSQLAEDV